MKIKPEHYEVLKSSIDKIITPDLIAQYESGNFPRVCKDLQRRFCFDMLYLSGLTHYVCENIYTYANDDHLYTALKQICPRLKK